MAKNEISTLKLAHFGVGEPSFHQDEVETAN